LQKLICPNVDLLTDPWLFQSLTHYLDKAVLQDLISSKIKHTPFNLNLNMNISSLMTEEFLKWDEKLGSKNRKQITIELQKMDIFADMGAYQYIRDFLHTRGYKICLDGLTHLTLPLIDWKRLGVDCIKLYWSGEMIHNTTLATTIDKEDFAKTILAHCDDPQAIKWGKDHHIKSFQGWHIDQLLMPGYSQE
jgi:EAL domain-containing protein (putative c-di-GMP-specific phosphodiesterase class I)